jgi:hypothetical protein
MVFNIFGLDIYVKLRKPAEAVGTENASGCNADFVCLAKSDISDNNDELFVDRGAHGGPGIFRHSTSNSSVQAFIGGYRSCFCSFNVAFVQFSVGLRDSAEWFADHYSDRLADEFSYGIVGSSKNFGDAASNSHRATAHRRI